MVLYNYYCPFVQGFLGVALKTFTVLDFSEEQTFFFLFFSSLRFLKRKEGLKKKQEKGMS